VWLFAFFQLCARIFLASEYAVAMVDAAEEYLADRRGMVIGGHLSSDRAGEE
jgi:hypothetical protein